MIFNALLTNVANAGGCPMGFDRQHRVPAGHDPAIGRVAPKGYLEAFAKIDLREVKEDLKALFVDSKDFFPADYNNYGPLMIRLAWHSAGSYRVRDGRGGSDGGRQRFDPERSWDDNTNLDKARKLLEPIKEKYGLGLSWGDLIVLAGDTAIESMGGPIAGFCGGRIDDANGFWSERLGPNAVQAAAEPCPQPPCGLQGATELGLVYVNPEGPLLNGVRQVDPALSGIDVRATFGRMGMNDTETVALVGGGHAFGKTHGACPDGAGPSPMQDPENPWPGLCGTGKGIDTATSGFEGPWTSNPIAWDNEYFANLLEYEWEEWTGPGGKQQWRPTNAIRMAPEVTGDATVAVMMTTADLAMRYDPEYLKISTKFKDDLAYLDEQFSEAWYKLMTRDMGPRERCLGDMVPEARPFQNPLPNPPSKLADFEEVKNMIRTAATNDITKEPGYQNTGAHFGYAGADMYDGEVNYGPLFVKLAWRCASTHRVTDYTGGCNGARIRLSPQKDWPINAGLDFALDLLAPIKEEFGDSLSWADLIVLAGNTGLEMAGAPKLPFCGGRTDATEDGDAGVMEPLLNEDMSNSLDDLQESALLLGVTPREWTALMGRRSLGRHHGMRGGFMGHTDETPTMMDNEYFKSLLSNDWQSFTNPETDQDQYKASLEGGDFAYALRSDYLLTLEPQFLTAAQDFAADNDMFLEEFAAAWTKVMNADRFDGPAGNLCEPYQSEEEMEMTGSGCPMEKIADNETALIIAVVVFVSLFLLSVFGNLIQVCRSTSKGANRRGTEMAAKRPAPGVEDMEISDRRQSQQYSPRGARQLEEAV